MGSSSSKGKQHEAAAKYGQIYLETDRSAYLAGENVTGKIYLNLVQPYPGNQITLKLKGKEYSSIVHQRSETYHTGEGQARKTETRNVEDLIEEKNDIIKLSVPVYQWPNLMPGQYTIPFNFVLPYTIPSSFFQEGFRYLAHISYQLEANLQPFSNKDPKMKHKQPLIVRQPIVSQSQSYETEITTPLTTWCCCSRGTNKLKVRFEKNCYQPGEKANVIVQLDNADSKLNNKKIEFSLIQKLSVKARSQSIKKEFDKITRHLEGIPSRGSGNKSYIELNLPKFQAENPKHPKRSNLKQYLLALRDESESLNPETKGRLVTSEYFLRVSCPMEGCCSDTPTVECPIEIYYPDIQIPPVYAPSDWAPQMINPVNLSFGQTQGPYITPEKGIGMTPDQSLMQNQSNSTHYQSTA